jgi:uncharacterized protein (DUF1778 family)
MVTALVRKSRVDARLDLRLSEPTKERIDRAAKITGRTATEFVRTAAESAAQKVLAEYERTILAEDERELFFAALLNPGSPSKALLEAAERHKRLVGSP